MTRSRKKLSRTRRVKRVRRVRTRGGMEDNASDRIRTLLHDLFPEFDISRFMITETDKYYKVDLTQCEEQEKHPLKYYPLIYIYKDGTMFIILLTSCSPLSGAEIIRRYIALARQLGLKSIHLSDVSNIYFPSSRYGDEDCAVDLAILRILLRGTSWYESLGFKVAITDSQKKDNEKIRKMPFGEFIRKLIIKEKSVEIRQIIRKYPLQKNNAQRNREMANIENKKSELEELLHIFPEIHKDTPVYQGIQFMVDQINSTQNPCESKPFRMLQNVVKLCTLTQSPLIHYDREDLVMTL